MDIKEISKDELGEVLARYAHLHDADDPLSERGKILAVWGAIYDNNDIIYFGVYTCQVLVASCTISIIPNLTRGCRPYDIIENVITHRDFRRRAYRKLF